MASVNFPTLAPVAPKTNIFSAPLKGRVEAAELARKHNQKIGMIKLALVLAVLAAYSYYFFYPQLTGYLAFNKTMASDTAEIANLEDEVVSLSSERDSLKAAYEKKNKEEQDIVNAVLPSNTDKIGVIRLMENFATNLNAAYPPFEFNAISFQNVVKEKNYVKLPFTTSIRTTRANFDRFLELVKMSGNAEPEAQDHIRLMDISNITLRYMGTDATGRDLGVQFTVQMNAYSRTPEATKG